MKFEAYFKFAKRKKSFFLAKSLCYILLYESKVENCVHYCVWFLQVERNILATNPRVTRFKIDWDDNTDSENVPPTNSTESESNQMKEGSMAGSSKPLASAFNTESNSNNMEVNWQGVNRLTVTSVTMAALIGKIQPHCSIYLNVIQLSLVVFCYNCF